MTNLHFLRLTPAGVDSAREGAIFATGSAAYAIREATPEWDVFTSRKLARVPRQANSVSYGVKEALGRDYTPVANDRPADATAAPSHVDDMVAGMRRDQAARRAASHRAHRAHRARRKARAAYDRRNVEQMRDAIRDGLQSTGTRPSMTKILSAAINLGATDGEAIYIARSLGVRCKLNDARYRRKYWDRYMFSPPHSNDVIVAARGWCRDLHVDLCAQPATTRRKW